jgi:protoheme IX farnesyltransferase
LFIFFGSANQLKFSCGLRMFAGSVRRRLPVCVTITEEEVKTLLAYLNLTKPTIMLLVIFTGSAALVLEGSFLLDPLRFLLVLVGLYLAGGSANALNQYFERSIDAQMSRTQRRRPLPLSQITPKSALVFSIAIGIAGVAIFAIFFNWLTAILALGTLLFYALYYTLWLKPRTFQNIVIGGIAGAMAPVGAWTAATGTMAWEPWILFAIIFFWTPPHFWALAMVCKDDYEKVGLPMLPVIKGEKVTLNYILYYTIVVVAVSLLLLVTSFSWMYLVASAILGYFFLQKAWYVRRHFEMGLMRKLFGYSIVYLLALFAVIIIDGLV